MGMSWSGGGGGQKERKKELWLVYKMKKKSLLNKKKDAGSHVKSSYHGRRAATIAKNHIFCGV